MRIIPVLDVKNGGAVHARGGDRDHYAPVASILHEGADPVALARAYRDVLGLSDVYIADLDAIAGAPPSRRMLREVADLGMRTWVDAGVAGPGEVAPLIDAGASLVIVGLETLTNPVAGLSQMVAEYGAERIVFSLDLRAGRPMVPTRESWGTDDPRAIAGIAVARGVRRMILLDLARVGTGAGLGTEALLRGIRRDHPDVQVTVGGGIATRGDLDAMDREGAEAVLVGSALHDGRIGRGREAG